jgi:hypothetical protein
MHVPLVDKTKKILLPLALLVLLAELARVELLDRDAHGAVEARGDDKEVRGAERLPRRPSRCPSARPRRAIDPRAGSAPPDARSGTARSSSACSRAGACWCPNHVRGGQKARDSNERTEPAHENNAVPSSRDLVPCPRRPPGAARTPRHRRRGRSAGPASIDRPGAIFRLSGSRERGRAPTRRGRTRRTAPPTAFQVARDPVGELGTAHGHQMRLPASPRTLCFWGSIYPCRVLESTFTGGRTRSPFTFFLRPPRSPEFLLPRKDNNQERMREVRKGLPLCDKCEKLEEPSSSLATCRI